VDLTDEALVNSFRATKEPRYFTCLVGRYQNRVFNAAFRILGNTHECEEVVQETFLKIIQNLEKFEGKASFAAWLFAISHNVCIDLLRNRKRKGTYKMVSFDPQSNHDDDSVEVNLNVVSQIKDPTPDPAHQLDSIEQQATVATSLQKLPDSQRVVLVLHDIEGFSYQEIAEIVGVSVGTVRSRLHYGRQKLRELLDPYFNQAALTPRSR
jgi:RNA polymerase sigma-70 factor, ECF subfamily